MRLGPALLGAALLFVADAASAALTSSEKGQIRDYVARAQSGSAQKVRSLVARTDLSRDESVAALTDALVPVAFTKERAAYLEELVFGSASAASRPIVTLATARALLSRADAVFERHEGGPERDPRAVEELAAIYGWLGRTIANAGAPAGEHHDASVGLPPAIYEECAKALAAHVDRHARALKGQGKVSASMARVRAQAQLTLIDMMPSGLTRLVGAADRLGLTGARRAMLTEWGVLYADVGEEGDARAERVRELLRRAPAARVSLGAIYAGSGDSGRLQARGAIAYITPAAEPPPLEGPAAGYDPAVGAVAHGLAALVAKRALELHPELRAQVERDVAAASGQGNRLLGRPRAPSVEHVLGAAIHALLVEGPRAVDVALARLAKGRPEAAALLSDALGALAVASAERSEADGKTGAPASTIDVGKGGAFVTASKVRFAPNGVVLGFTLDGRSIAIDRAGPSYEVTAAKRDGKVIAPAPAP